MYIPYARFPLLFRQPFVRYKVYTVTPRMAVYYAHYTGKVTASMLQHASFDVYCTCANLL